DESGARVLKVQVDHGETWANAEVFESLRLDHAKWDGNDYERSALTEHVYLPGGRVLYAPGIPTTAAKSLHLLLEVGDHLGSTSIVIDHDTSELVERTTYMAYGQTENDYRPKRWNSFRETYHFTGKEDDLDIGLTYFGARYYVAAL